MVGLLAADLLHGALQAGVQQGDVAVGARCQQGAALPQATHRRAVLGVDLQAAGSQSGRARLRTMPLELHATSAWHHEAS